LSKIAFRFALHHRKVSIYLGESKAIDLWARSKALYAYEVHYARVFRTVLKAFGYEEMTLLHPDGRGAFPNEG
jgi:hypothetical protein